MAIKFSLQKQLRKEAKQLAKNIIKNSGQFGKETIAIKDVAIMQAPGAKKNVFKFVAGTEVKPLTWLGKLKAAILGPMSEARLVVGEVRPAAKSAEILRTYKI